MNVTYEIDSISAVERWDGAYTYYGKSNTKIVPKKHKPKKPSKPCDCDDENGKCPCPCPHHKDKDKDKNKKCDCNCKTDTKKQIEKASKQLK